MGSTEATRAGGSLHARVIASDSARFMQTLSCVRSALLDGVDLQKLAEHHGTPLHVLDACAMRNRIHSLQSALLGMDALICFAAKANSNHAVLKLMAEHGVGADIVSGGELERCLRAGIPAERIVFSGVGKTTAEMREALHAGVGRFNVESADELECLQAVASGCNMLARAAVRINPDVDAQTHAKISTGKAENKFGVSIDEARSWFARSNTLSHVRMDGLHVHIGSQILSLDPFRAALASVVDFQRELAAAGNIITSIDVGGGLGVRYRPDQDSPPEIADYVGVLREALRNFGGRIVLEPGRWLVAEAGLLLTRVIRIKQGEQRRFLIIDAAMNDLLRPSLYEAWHEIEPIKPKGGPRRAYEIVGPVCETGDTFARARELPECTAGDLLAIMATGAYGMSMASTYNSRPLAAEVMVDGGRHALVRQRQSLDAMMADEVTSPQWTDA